MDYSDVTSPSAMSVSSLAPLDSNLSFARNFDVALRHAQDLRKGGKFDEAARVLAQLVLAAPDDPRVIGEYGKVMLESGRTDDAVSFLERAATLQPSDWTLLSALGVAYDQTGKRDAARASFHRALALKPGESTVLSNLALSHIQAGELDEAERLLLQASEQRKDVPGIAAKLAMVRNIRTTTAQSRPLTAATLPQPVASAPVSSTEIRPPAELPAIPPVSAAVEAAEEPIEDEDPATVDDTETQEVATALPVASVPQLSIAAEVSKINALTDISKVEYEVVHAADKSSPKPAAPIARKNQTKSNQVSILSDNAKVVSKVSVAAKAPAKPVAVVKAEPAKSSPAAAAVAPRVSVSMQPAPKPAPVVVSTPAPQVAGIEPPSAKTPAPVAPEAMANPTPQAAIMTRRADVATAVGRTAPVPLVLAPARDSWESMVRVSLPPAADATPKPVLAAAQDNTPMPSAKPASWSDIVKGWVTAALGFISAFWA